MTSVTIPIKNSIPAPTRSLRQSQFIYAGLGNGGANIEPVKLLGAQALGAAIGQNMRYTKSDNRDYEFHDGVGVDPQYSFEKLFYRGGNRADETHGRIEGYIAF